MKKIEASIKPFKMDELKSALMDAGIGDVRIFQLQEIGDRKHREFYRGAEYAVQFEPRIMFSMLVEDERVDRIVQIIQETAGTNNEGDGQILVIPVELAEPIGTDDVPETA